MYNRLMLIVGLTGNYGMGKSSVLSMFKELGAVTVDADWIVKRLLIEQRLRNRIKVLLGPGVFDIYGNLDKGKTAEKIFKDKNLRLKLEEILHPLVFEKIDGLIKGGEDAAKVFIVEASLIYERDYEDRFDRTITVFTDEATAIKRLGSSGITPAMARQRLQCQLPIKGKIKKSDFKIDNSDGIERTMSQAAAIYKKLCSEAEIKMLISQGKVHEAARLLSKPYCIEGKVIKGTGRGKRLLHTPTANISIFKKSALREGVYAVRVSMPKKQRQRLYDGVANIGDNPTFGAPDVNYEVHIFDFSGNLLGKKLKIHFISRLRDEKKFRSAKALGAQINKDIKKAKDILAREKT